MKVQFSDYARTRLANADKVNRGHIWISGKLSLLSRPGTMPTELCQQCVVIRRADDNNKPCVGPVPVRTR